MLAPFHARTPRDRKVVVISITLAVVAHIAILVWFKIERTNRANHNPPGLSGLGRSGEVAVQAGLPMTSQMNRHHFRVITDLNGSPVPRVRVTDIFENTEAFTDAEGIAVMPVRPGAKLAVHVERPGFAKQALELPNLNRDHDHTIILHAAPVTYAQVDSLFIQRCTYCHGAVGKVAGVDLTSFQKTIGSTWHGNPIVVPYNPDSSRIVRVLLDTRTRDGKMTAHTTQTSPPSEFAIETIAEWIKAGARIK